jgi:hypothetical protein
MTNQVPDQKTPNQVNDLADALTTATPEELATALNNDRSLKKKLMVALRAETIEDLDELMLAVNSSKGSHRLKKGMQKLPFYAIGKMQKLFIPANPDVPDPCRAYAAMVSQTNRPIKDACDKWLVEGRKGEVDKYVFRLIRKPNGAILVRVPSFEHYTWEQMVDEYRKYGLTPREPTNWVDIQGLQYTELANEIQALNQADLTPVEKP